MTIENIDVWASGPRHTFRYCELAKGQKRPINNNWQTDTKSFEEVRNAYKNKQANIGLVLGSTSGVMDIDCDSHEAVIITRHLVDDYFGHFTRCDDSAHYLFLCEQGGKTVRLADTEGKALVELRGDGGQTMVPSFFNFSISSRIALSSLFISAIALIKLLSSSRTVNLLSI